MSTCSRETGGEARSVSASLPPLAQPQVERLQDLLDGDTGRRPGDVAYDAVHAVDFMLKYLAGQMSVFDGDAAALHSDTSRKRGFRLGVGTRGACSQVLPSSSAISGRSSSALSSPPSIVEHLSGDRPVRAEFGGCVDIPETGRRAWDQPSLQLRIGARQ